MIRKPSEAWGREAPAVAALRNAAATGRSAVQTGVRVWRGVWLCGFGALWLFGALTSGLFMGSLPSLIGCGVVGSLFFTAGLRTLRPRAGPGQAAARPAPGPTAAAIDYSRGKLLAQSGFGAVFLTLAAGAAGHLKGPAHLVAIVLVPVFAAIALASLRKAFGDLTALRWDARGLTVATLFSRRDAPWASVRSIALEQVNTYAGYGLLKVGSRQVLAIRLADGPRLGRRLALSAALLQLEGRTLEGLALALQAAQLGRAGGGMAAAPRHAGTAAQGGAQAAPHEAAPRHPSADQAPYPAPPAFAPASAASFGGPAAPRAFGRRGA